MPQATNAVTLALATNPGSGTLSGTTTVNAVAGVATFSGLSVNKTGTGYTLVASGSTLPSATSAAFTIAAGPPAELTFSGQPPRSNEINLVLAPAVMVTIRDALGNLTGAAVTVALGANTSSATLAGTLTADAVDGVAAFSNLRVNKRGEDYTLVATAGGATGESVPFDVAFALIEVSAAGNHTCARSSGAAVWCWGDNSNGELGNGTETSSNSPVPVSGGLRFAQVSAGPVSTCGVRIGGAAYCWGRGGHLGDGTEVMSTTPVLVSGGLVFRSVAAGVPSCGVTTGDEMYCWGMNLSGGLGNGTTTNSTIPVLVSGQHTFYTVSAGSHYACGLSTGGQIYCWGANDGGQLGDGTTTNSTTPVLVSGNHSFGAVSASVYHTCGVGGAGAAYCWGSGGDGQLGDGAAAESLTPVLVSNGLSFWSVSVGGAHTCGVTTPGTGASGHCWGYNIDGQVGNGTTSNATTPAAVLGGHAFFNGLSASARGNHSCGIAVGAVYCWGGNFSGQLGDGTTTNRSAPVRVLDP